MSNDLPGIAFALDLTFVVLVFYSIYYAYAQRKCPAGSLRVIAPNQPLSTHFLSATPSGIILFNGKGREQLRWPADVSGKVVKLRMSGASASYRGVSLTVSGEEMGFLFPNRFMWTTKKSLAAGVAALQSAGVKIEG